MAEKTYAELITLLAQAVDDAGGGPMFQVEHDIWNVYEMLNGKRKMTDNALRAIGYRKRVIYEKIE